MNYRTQDRLRMLQEALGLARAGAQVVVLAPTFATLQEVKRQAVLLDPEGTQAIRWASNVLALRGRRDLKVFRDWTWHEHATPLQKREVSDAMTVLESIARIG